MMPADNSVLMEEPATATAPALHKTTTPSEQMGTISTSMDQTCINNNQTSELQTPENDPATESVNTDDFSNHTPVQRPGPQTATNPLQPPIADIESNASGIED